MVPPRIMPAAGKLKHSLLAIKHTTVLSGTVPAEILGLDRPPSVISFRSATDRWERLNRFVGGF